MLIVLVSVRVKPERVADFTQATLINARASVGEPGVQRFDVLQQHDDPCRFTLVEVYRTADAPAAHKQTSHYNTWRAAVEEMMAEPRQSTRFQKLFPADAGF
jgi:quinol monooxygenase YgiN